MRTKCKRPKRVENAVFSQSQLAIRVCQYPLQNLMYMWKNSLPLLTWRKCLLFWATVLHRTPWPYWSGENLQLVNLCHPSCRLAKAVTNMESPIAQLLPFGTFHPPMTSHHEECVVSDTDWYELGYYLSADWSYVLQASLLLEDPRICHCNHQVIESTLPFNSGRAQDSSRRIRRPTPDTVSLVYSPVCLKLVRSWT